MSLSRRKTGKVFSLLILITIAHYFGVFTHIFEKSFTRSFRYPYDGDVQDLVHQMRSNRILKVAPINLPNFKFKHTCIKKCQDVVSLHLTILVKSNPKNWRHRRTIRSSWGFEKRFSDVEIRTVFLVGEVQDENLELDLEVEYAEFKDLVRADFIDSYRNLTVKTIMGLTWLAKYCPTSKFYMFVDDDYYVSTKNLLKFLRNAPLHHERFYGGFVFRSAPQRHRTSKWYISLEEYPYDMWPPYVSSTYVLSKEAALDMFYASFYTRVLRFEDVFVGLLAYKCRIEPYHSNDFHFYKLPYNRKVYGSVVAAQGNWGPERITTIWREQKRIGNA